MNVIQMTGTTNSDGTLTLTLPLGQPNTTFEVAVVVQPEAANGTRPEPKANRFAVMDQIRERLAATGRDFGDSAEDIREDRDR